LTVCQVAPVIVAVHCAHEFTDLEKADIGFAAMELGIWRIATPCRIDDHHIDVTQIFRGCPQTVLVRFVILQNIRWLEVRLAGMRPAEIVRTS